jgi:hypothetical protein
MECLKIAENINKENSLYFDYKNNSFKDTYDYFTTTEVLYKLYNQDYKYWNIENLNQSIKLLNK